MALPFAAYRTPRPILPGDRTLWYAGIRMNRH